MDWQAIWEDPFSCYLSPFHALIGDVRTRTTLTETVQGIIGAGSLVCQRIAAHSPILVSAHKCRVKFTARQASVSVACLCRWSSMHELDDMGRELCAGFGC